MSSFPDGVQVERPHGIVQVRSKGSSRPDGFKKPNYSANSMHTAKNKSRRFNGTNHNNVTPKNTENSNGNNTPNPRFKSNFPPAIYEIKKRERLADEATEILNRLWNIYHFSPAEIFSVLRDNEYDEELTRHTLQAKKDSSWSAVVQKGISNSVPVPVQKVVGSPSSQPLTQQEVPPEPTASFDDVAKFLEMQLNVAEEKSKQIRSLKQELENTHEKSQMEALKEEREQLIASRHQLDNELKSIALRLVEIDKSLELLEQKTAARVAEIARAAKVASQSNIKREIYD